MGVSLFEQLWNKLQGVLSKTFASAAIGIAIGEHRLKLTDRLATFFPEYLPKEVSEWLSDITIEDLLTMRSGFVFFDEVRSEHLDWVKTYLNHPMNCKPGTKFQYDSLDTYLLSAIIQKVTGMTLLEYLKPRLFEPLHINKVKWEMSPEGINTAGWGLYLQSESLAKFGQLLLQQGKWEGKQLIPSGWVKAMMSPHVEDFYEVHKQIVSSSICGTPFLGGCPSPWIRSHWVNGKASS